MRVDLPFVLDEEGLAADARADFRVLLAAPTLATWLSRAVIGSLLLTGGLVVFRDAGHAWGGRDGDRLWFLLHGVDLPEKAKAAPAN